MQNDDGLTEQFGALLEGKIQIHGRIEDLGSSYREAKPFPHLVIDDMFDPALLDALLDEMAAMRADKWDKVDQDPRERTRRMKSAMHLGEAGERLLGIVHSAAFLHFLSEITGIGRLLPDPYLLGSGYAQMQRGDYFNVHSDRNVAYDTGMLRRLAMIVFLNKTWSPEYHGQLELWNHEATRCEVTVDPLFNKTVLFEVAYPNFHGVPVPLACPPDRTRQSFILYYHTVGNKGESEVKPHTSLFAPRAHGTNRLTLRQFAREITPPFMLRVIRKFSRYEW
ncbi:MAG: 2OG-Fe(II) oxygenase [Pseudomonadota bacterium]|nr:2OG-Fe(II) oxygenase [Pseudomonadota bacterium]